MQQQLSTFALAALCCISFQSKAYQIQFKSNVANGTAYLTYYMGKNLNIQDSAVISKAGIASFAGKAQLPGGIYAIVFGNKKYSIDFLLGSSQNLFIQADTANLLQTEITGSKDNDIFKDYQRFVAQNGRLLMAEKKAFNESTNRADSLLHEKNYNKYNDIINQYRLDIITKSPTSLMAVLLQAMREPQVPAAIPLTREDSLRNYYAYKKSYWDGISFADDRVVRTPFFIPKLERYYREVMDQSQVDTLISDIDYKLLLARTAPEMYKYLLNWFTDEYINPKYMGQDAVFVHLFEKYHSKGLTPWLNEQQMEIISRRAYMQMANLIGVKAADITMLNTAEKPTSLYSVDANYTLLLFWDPTCGHCKQELPKIDSIYRASWKQKGVKIFAVLNENVKDQWLQYIKDQNISDWIHVYQTKDMAAAETTSGKAGYRQLFDVTMTPTLLLLDKEKRIVAKKLTWEQVNQLLLVKENNKSAN